MFLVGPPGPEKLRLALWYAELVGRDVGRWFEPDFFLLGVLKKPVIAEVLNVSRDTTESDLKQRREIANSTVLHVDQAPVRAAINGEKCLQSSIKKYTLILFN